LENGDIELQLNPSCLRYLSELNNTYGAEARGRLGSSVGLRAFGPVSVVLKPCAVHQFDNCYF
jgi:hypothetical protein